MGRQDWERMKRINMEIRRIQEIPDREERIKELEILYSKSPDGHVAYHLALEYKESGETKNDIEYLNKAKKYAEYACEKYPLTE